MSWDKVLTAIAACGGVGALIDQYWLGDAGQRRMRDALETWWIRFSDVRIGNFGREEALVAVRIMDKMFGRRFFSSRRLCVILVVPMAIFVFVWLILSRHAGRSVFSFAYDWNLPLTAISFVFAVFLFWTSLSFTRAYARFVARLCGIGPIRNLVVLLVTLAVSYCLAAFSVPWSISIAAESGLQILGVILGAGGTLWGLVTFESDSWIVIVAPLYTSLLYAVRNFHLSPMVITGLVNHRYVQVVSIRTWLCTMQAAYPR